MISHVRITVKCCSWHLSLLVERIHSFQFAFSMPQERFIILDGWQKAAKAIYSLKMILFRNQFKMTAEEVKGLMSVSLFTAVIYAKFWHRASLAEQAPLNDKIMLSHLQEYPDDIIRKAALRSICRHLWFFSEHLVVLSLFDDRQSSEVKVRMFHNFKRKPEEKFHRRLDGKRFDCSMELDEFVTERSLKFFNLLKMEKKKY